jgi:hypothetical protein
VFRKKLHIVNYLRNKTKNMPCYHKFINREKETLLPDWKCNTLIIGTFNPENKFHPSNTAEFFYQRSRNYFWDVFPLISGDNPISKNNTSAQKEYLKKNKIGITDLLLAIQDADENDKNHLQKISTVKDDDIESFSQFKWNTQPILNFIKSENCTHVYFTRLGQNNGAVHVNSFENQMRIIEQFCDENNIFTSRLHTPTGMRLGEGKRIPTLLNRWITENGADQMPFYREKT